MDTTADGHALTALLGYLLAALAVAMVTVGLCVVTAPPSVGATETAVRLSMSSETYEQGVQHFINRERVRHGLGRLRFESCTDGTAERWAAQLAATGQFFHQSPGTILDTCQAFYAGETLGRGSFGPRGLVKRWMRSPAHRPLLLSKTAKRIGVGTYSSSAGWVTAANFTRF